MKLHVIGVLLTTTLSFVLGCSGSDSTDATQNGSCTTYNPPAGTNLTTPVVSFRADVVPMFAQDCARSACHAGAGGAPNRGVTLDGDPAAMRTALLGVSTESTLRYVAPGDPSNSYLQHKIDGDLCAVASTCGGDCLDTMPQAESLLSESDRLVIRRWIAQGAADN